MTHRPNLDKQTRSDQIQTIANDCLIRRDAGEDVPDESIIEAHPELMPELAEWLRAVSLLRAVQPASGADSVQESTRSVCPHCETSVSVEDPPPSDLTCPACGQQFSVSVNATLASGSASPSAGATAGIPAQIGRYQIEEVLGQGAFGRVFLARDEQLSRLVAIKVPHARIVSNPYQAEEYLAEARTIASLDHPHIVSVHDVGSTAEFPCFIICKYVDGNDLSTMVKNSRLSYREAAELVAIVAEALHHAHKQGLVHRDIKPGNILIDHGGKPYVVDFGLALRDASAGKGPRYAGTPAYMSPEQARGEGHRVDGRSDIFSLGVVLYELLVGRRPFRGDTQSELFEQITRYEPRPVRQYGDVIPKELERICHKAMAKRAQDRYFTAKDLAEDLRTFLSERSPTTESDIGSRASGASASMTATPGSTSVDSASRGSTTTGSGSSLGSEPLKIVPKGLRSFDAHDADFFLELLPGPRDRSGLPDSIRFWKTRIEEFDPDDTFSVGLIYGPSGCGKSSLVKAGLLPRLSEDVVPLYIEATADGTETRLAQALRRRCTAVEDRFSLTEILAALRRGHALPAGKKLLIVLDQFEQWLHAKTGQEHAELAQALRQCDGGRVQCILLVRDDFWMAVTRFLRELEVRLLEDQNFAAVDLFPERHATKVLAAFGRAFGALPQETDKTSKSQLEFLKQSVAGLSEDGKVTCVRLSLFAEMMKDKSWDPSTLKALGGTEGVGVTFLDETFNSSSASPEHRFHQKAARQVLKALLPDASSDIRGHMRSYDELLEASGYFSRQKDFAALIKMLDSDIRLITPTDSEGAASDIKTVPSAEIGKKHYQLTHDYLVHSLRQWLTRKQRETRRGRAELLLTERAVLWNAKPENQHLPALWEYVKIRLLTRRQSWTKSQREMMAKAGRIHGARCACAILLALVVSGTIQRAMRRNLEQRVRTSVESLNSSRGIILPPLENLDKFPRKILLAELQEQFDLFDEVRKLPIAFALARYGDRRVDFLVSQIASAFPDELDNFIEAFKSDDSEAVEEVVTALKAAATTADRTQDWPQKARLATLALHLQDSELAIEMCLGGADPVQRAWFVEECSKWYGYDSTLADCAKSNGNSRLRAGLMLAVGSIPTEKVTDTRRREWEKSLLEWFETEPDKPTHSSAGWVLRRWGIPNDIEPTPRSEVAERLGTYDWYVNTVGMTMLKIPEGHYVRIAYENDIADDEQEELTGAIDQSVELEGFLLADREVTQGQFRQFVIDEGYPFEKSQPQAGVDIKYDTTPEHPVNYVSWYDAVLYCNWLSWKEGLDRCYKRNNQKLTLNRGLPFDVQLESDKNGYRLPTEAEWDYACRAGTTTVYNHGDDQELLKRYFVYGDYDAPQIPGSKLPNQWGLFDMNGNLSEWCWDWSGAYPREESVKNPEGPARSNRHAKIIRGNVFNYGGEYLRSGWRHAITPTQDNWNLGFRVARTLPSRSFVGDDSPGERSRQKDEPVRGNMP